MEAAFLALDCFFLDRLEPSSRDLEREPDDDEGTDDDEADATDLPLDLDLDCDVFFLPVPDVNVFRDFSCSRLGGVLLLFFLEPEPVPEPSLPLSRPLL